MINNIFKYSYLIVNILFIEYLLLDRNTWKYLTEYKQISFYSFKNKGTNTLFAYKNHL